MSKGAEILLVEIMHQYRLVSSIKIETEHLIVFDCGAFLVVEHDADYVTGLDYDVYADFEEIRVMKLRMTKKDFDINVKVTKVGYL